MKQIYQKKNVSLNEVINNISIKEKPKVYLAVSPCRCASTVILRAFGTAGIQSHFQELKNVLRWLMQGEPKSFEFPKKKESIMLKETLGPYTETECSFNPLEVLLKAGLPSERIHLLVLGREPYQTWASWVNWWQNKTSVDLFNLSFQTTEAIRIQADELNIETTCLMYELFKDKSVESVFKNLFRRLDLIYTPSVVGGWGNLPQFGAEGSNIVLPLEPDPFITPNIHSKVEKSEKYIYMSRKEKITNLKKSDLKKIDRSPLHNIYECWLNMSKKESG